MTGTRQGGQAGAAPGLAPRQNRLPGERALGARRRSSLAGRSHRAVQALPAVGVRVLRRRDPGRRGRCGASRPDSPASGIPHDHAEEVALARAASAGAARRLAGATLYSSLEPCAARASRPRPCAELIIEAGLRRVVIAWLEPPVFVEGGGAARLRAAGVTVIEIPELAATARAVNAHLLPR